MSEDSANISAKLFCDCKTDEEKSDFFLSGRAHETGIVAASVQNDVAMAYHRCSEFQKLTLALTADADQLRQRLDDLEGSDEDLKKVERALDGYDYRGSYADAIMQLRQRVAGLEALPDDWRLIEKPTCYQLARGNGVVANLVGPDAEENAAILARAITAAASDIREVAVIEEQLDDNCARIRWLFNPVPDGQLLQWDHSA